MQDQSHQRYLLQYHINLPVVQWTIGEGCEQQDLVFDHFVL